MSKAQKILATGVSLLLTGAVLLECGFVISVVCKDIREI